MVFPLQTSCSSANNIQTLPLLESYMNSVQSTSTEKAKLNSIVLQNPHPTRSWLQSENKVNILSVPITKHAIFADRGFSVHAWMHGTNYWMILKQTWTRDVLNHSSARPDQVKSWKDELVKVKISTHPSNECDYAQITITITIQDWYLFSQDE